MANGCVLERERETESERRSTLDLTFWRRELAAINSIYIHTGYDCGAHEARQSNCTVNGAMNDVMTAS
jgi:hypothetical protein